MISSLAKITKNKLLLQPPPNRTSPPPPSNSKKSRIKTKKTTMRTTTEVDSYSPLSKISKDSGKEEDLSSRTPSLDKNKSHITHYTNQHYLILLLIPSFSRQIKHYTPILHINTYQKTSLPVTAEIWKKCR